MKNPKILVVEDEAIVALSLKRRLEEMGYTVAGPLSRGEDAVAQARELAPDLILMDIHLAGPMDGVDAASLIQAKLPVPIIYLTAYAEDATLERARATSPYGYVVKPFDARELHAAIQMALERRTAERAMEQREELLRLALDAAEMAAFEIDPKSRKLLRTGRVNRLCEPAVEPVTAGLDDFLVKVHPTDRPRVEEAIRQALEEGTGLDIEFRTRTASGTRWLNAHGKLAPEGLVGVVADVTERRQTSERLRQAAGVLEATAEGIFVFDGKARILSVNQAFTRITGYPPEEAIGRTAAFLDSGRHGPEFFADMKDSLARTGQWQGEIWDRRKNGEIYPAWETISSIHDEQGHITHYVAAFSDISSLRDAEERLNYLAYHDSLTGLPNRILLADRLDGLLAHADRYGQMVGLLFLDLDRFKAINDTLGHAAGDTLLQIVAQRLRERLRGEDTLARLGGDEFVVLLPDIGRGEFAATVAAKLLAATSTPVELEGETYTVTASIGIGLFPDDAADRHDLLRVADAAMYKAKAAGKNAYAFFDTRLTEHAREELFLESGLRQALAEGHLELYYQPQLSLPELEVTGIEALLRWRHPERGLIPPGCFIPVAEQSSLILDLSRWVLETACRQLVEFDAMGLSIPHVAVNLSPRQLLYGGGFSTDVARALEVTGLTPDRLEIEVTETALQHTDSAIETLTELRKLGIQVAMDDFGTGYSCLASLKNLPLDRLKIDRAFIEGLPHQSEDLAIVGAILAVGGALQLGVIVEGVETQEQLDCLKQAGCRQVQGYVLGKPMPAKRLVDWLRSR